LDILLFYGSAVRRQLRTAEPQNVEVNDCKRFGPRFCFSLLRLDILLFYGSAVGF
jgi:hypothetical protein